MMDMLPPAAAPDFYVTGLEKTYDYGDSIRVIIIPKNGKSAGTVTIWYEGIRPPTIYNYKKSTKVPAYPGTYRVTFDVARADGWYSRQGLAAGTLVIKLPPFNDIETLEGFLDGLPGDIANSEDAPFPVELITDNADPSFWTKLYACLDSAGKYAAIDISGSTGIPQPETGNPGGGQQYIVNLLLPDEFTGVENEGGSSRFTHFTNLKSVSGENVASVADNAFLGRAGLENADFPLLARIGANAFKGCAGLTGAEYPLTTDIGEYAFENCSALTSVSFMRLVTIGKDAFEGCAALQNVGFPVARDISAMEAFLDSLPAHLGDSPARPFSVALAHDFNNGEWQLLYDGLAAQLPPKYINLDLPGSVLSDPSPAAGVAKSGQEFIAGFVFPNGYNGKITDNGFAHFENLASVSGANVSAIGDGAFRNIASLLSASFPQADVIGVSAFENCGGLASVSFPKATDIGVSAFKNCDSLVSVSFPSALSIGANSFEDCTALQGANFHAALTIGAGAFKNCAVLRNLSFPEVTNINNNAFEKCADLRDVVFLSALTIGDGVFKDCGHLGSADLPLATLIGAGVFENCANLSIVRMPKIESIGTRAFANTGNAELTLILDEHPPTVGVNLFDGVTAEKVIDVLVPVLSEYDALDFRVDNASDLNWGNAFRGKGWTRGGTGSLYGGGTVRSNIRLWIKLDPDAGGGGGGLALLTGVVRINGASSPNPIARDDTLTANISELGGNASRPVTFEWHKHKAGEDSVLLHSNVGFSSSYNLKNSDEGWTITVSADREGYYGTKTSDPTATVLYPLLGGSVSISQITSANRIDATYGGSGRTDEGTITLTWYSGTAPSGTNVGSVLGTTLTFPTAEGAGDYYVVASQNYFRPRSTAATIRSVTFNGNSNTAGSVPSSILVVSGQSITLPVNTGSLSRFDYSFSGWRSAATGGNTYSTGASFPTSSTGNTTIYAWWSPLALGGTPGINGNPWINLSVTAGNGNMNAQAGTYTYTWSTSVRTGTGSSFALQHGDQARTLTLTVTHSDRTGSVTASVYINTYHVTNETQWNQARTASGTITIVLGNNFTIAGHTSNTFTGVNVNMTITGNHTLTLSSTGNILRVGNGQTVTINGPTLVGRGIGTNNLNPLVYIVNGGTLNLQSGTIRDNRNAGNNDYDDGGGVYVEGQFNMSGGDIRNNVAAGYGGGVYIVGSGRINKTGGTIYGNNASAGLANDSTLGGADAGDAIKHWGFDSFGARHRNTTVGTGENLNSNNDTNWVWDDDPR